MGTKLQLTNQKFNRLTVLKEVGKDRGGSYLWLCKCDCGNFKIVRGVDVRKGHIKSCGCLRVDNLRERQEAKGNNNWKANNVGYSGLHTWINNHKPKPLFCECCGINPPHDCANISGEYKRDINDFEWLCRKCHMEKDGRLAKFKELPRGYMQRNEKGQFVSL